MPRQKNTPVEAFGPELMDLLLRAAKGEKIAIPLTRRVGKKLQLRLHMLRGAMKREDHPNWKIAARAKTSLKWEHDSPDSPANLYIFPADSEFSEALRKVNISGQKEEIAPKLLDEDPLDFI